MNLTKFFLLTIFLLNCTACTPEGKTTPKTKTIPEEQIDTEEGQPSINISKKDYSIKGNSIIGNSNSSVLIECLTLRGDRSAIIRGKNITIITDDMSGFKSEIECSSKCTIYTNTEERYLDFVGKNSFQIFKRSEYTKKKRNKSTNNNSRTPSKINIKQQLDSKCPGSYHYSNTVSGLTFQYGEKQKEDGETLDLKNVSLYLKSDSINLQNIVHLSITSSRHISPNPQFPEENRNEKSRLDIIENPSNFSSKEASRTKSFHIFLDASIFSAEKIELTTKVIFRNGEIISDTNYFYRNLKD